ncbi:MAG: MFS transporter [Candidatus Nomurabacteria bacterium]
MQAITRNKLLLATFLMTILYAFHYGIPLYVTSTYLHVYFGSSVISSLYVVASLVTLLASIHVAKYIKKFHTYTFTMMLVVSEIIVMLAFALTKNPFLVGLFFVMHFCLQTLLYICINVFLEAFSKQANTGSIRGVFLVLLNLGILISPIIGGAILTRGSFAALYIVSTVILVPFMFFLHQYLNHIEEPAYHSIDMVKAFYGAWKNKDLKGALIASLMLECFYAVMVIYSPIYLASIGIPLVIYLSVILPLALIPFVILPYELGWLADTKIGEKELMVLGLIIISISLFLMVIATTPNVILWIMILLFSRIGAAFVETMTYAYYFKKIKAEDTSLTALFSNTRSVAIIIVGFLGFFINPMLAEYPQIIFIILGSIILFSILYIIPIKDTR